ncbi:hypothetical protein PCASD_02614 [Puccinia coronata f. sp. avenae]|uniref:YDG domain-containing protein n=1 Tax=Puccinia coronata f. sp. avenae TaxID=200324 RepID=A0A2N5VBD2_9BASI|nr:hypothetical protein PCASD_02614 [Puccinia coronata f. sp. avenae]
MPQAFPPQQQAFPSADSSFSSEATSSSSSVQPPLAITSAPSADLPLAEYDWLVHNFTQTNPRHPRLDRSTRQNPQRFGHIPGVQPGEEWEKRIEVSQAAVHAPPQGGISGTENRGGAESVVLNDGYPDGDCGDIIWYMGSGGFRSWDGKKTSIMQESQKLNKAGNAALRASVLTGNPVRVVRGSDAVHSPWAPESGYRYDGLYEVTRFDMIRDPTGQTEFMCCIFRMERLEADEYDIPVRIGFRALAALKTQRGLERQRAEDWDEGDLTSNDLLKRHKGSRPRQSSSSQPPRPSQANSHRPSPAQNRPTPSHQPRPLHESSNHQKQPVKPSPAVPQPKPLELEPNLKQALGQLSFHKRKVPAPPVEAEAFTSALPPQSLSSVPGTGPQKTTTPPQAEKPAAAAAAAAAAAVVPQPQKSSSGPSPTPAPLDAVVPRYHGLFSAARETLAAQKPLATNPPAYVPYKPSLTWHPPSRAESSSVTKHNGDRAIHRHDQADSRSGEGASWHRRFHPYSNDKNQYLPDRPPTSRASGFESKNPSSSNTRHDARPPPSSSYRRPPPSDVDTYRPSYSNPSARAGRSPPARSARFPTQVGRSPPARSASPPAARSARSPPARSNYPSAAPPQSPSNNRHTNVAPVATPGTSSTEKKMPSLVTNNRVESTSPTLPLRATTEKSQLTGPAITQEADPPPPLPIAKSHAEASSSRVGSMEREGQEEEEDSDDSSSSSMSLDSSDEDDRAEPASPCDQASRAEQAPPDSYGAEKVQLSPLPLDDFTAHIEEDQDRSQPASGIEAAGSNNPFSLASPHSTTSSKDSKSTAPTSSHFESSPKNALSSDGGNLYDEMDELEEEELKPDLCGINGSTDIRMEEKEALDGDYDGEVVEYSQEGIGGQEEDVVMEEVEGVECQPMEESGLDDEGGGIDELEEEEVVDLDGMDVRSDSAGLALDVGEEKEVGDDCYGRLVIGDSRWTRVGPLLWTVLDGIDELWTTVE